MRNLYLSDDPRGAAPRVYVGGQVATVLRFEQDVQPSGTKMMGWEGWFEPLLVGSRSVLLVPLQKLRPEDSFLLKVTLGNRTEWAFIVTARESGRVDQQVNVFPNRESSDAVRSRLSESQRRERVLLEENERYRREEISIDHGTSGTIAVVTDVRAFDFTKGAEKPVLQLFRSDGLMVAHVTLEEVAVRK